jgi:hypothetical protein
MNAAGVPVDFQRLLVDEGSTGQPAAFLPGLFTSWGGRTVDPTPVDNFPNCEEGDDCENVGVLRQFTVGTGLEYWYNDLLALRTGYFYEDPLNGNRQFLTFGAGFRYSLVGVDLSYIYALEENSPLDQQIRFSVLLNVNR